MAEQLVGMFACLQTVIHRVFVSRFLHKCIVFAKCMFGKCEMFVVVVYEATPSTQSVCRNALMHCHPIVTSLSCFMYILHVVVKGSTIMRIHSRKVFFPSYSAFLVRRLSSRNHRATCLTVNSICSSISFNVVYLGQQWTLKAASNTSICWLLSCYVAKLLYKLIVDC